MLGPPGTVWTRPLKDSKVYPAPGIEHHALLLQSSVLLLVCTTVRTGADFSSTVDYPLPRYLI